MKHFKKILILITITLIISSCASTEVRAVRQGDIQKLEKFLSKGGDPNEQDKECKEFSANRYRVNVSIPNRG